MIPAPVPADIQGAATYFVRTPLDSIFMPFMSYMWQIGMLAEDSHVGHEEDEG